MHVGLLPGVRWLGGGLTSVWGREHVPNIPTEEVFTSPTPAATRGTFTCSRPLEIEGRVIDGGCPSTSLGTGAGRGELLRAGD